MAKVDGPLFSFSASGSLADTIVFSRWKGRPYVRQRVIPSNPRTGLQVGLRQMFAFLAQQWASGLDSTQKASWDALAAQKVISPFDAYMGGGMDEWKTFDAPSKYGGVAPLSTPATIADNTATGGVGEATLQVDTALLNDGWGYVWFRATSTGFATALSNAILSAQLAGDSGSSIVVDSPLAPGTYFYNLRHFSRDGALSAEIGEVSAVVT